MADEKKQAEKEALKAQKQAEKEALKAKKERIKQSKPKKEGNIFTRMLNAIKKFFKDFKGTCKKVIWPDRKTVLKNTLIVFVTVVVVGAGIWLVDFAFSRGIRGVQDVISNSVSEEASDDETTTNSALNELSSSLSESASAENVTE
ncbi:MAG: preprotein translocase subunit SecE [Clostridia bacterium]|nr:preprotein translocase subunit SecE [Clostridia bacterium]